jgi:hypothetical protein
VAILVAVVVAACASAPSATGVARTEPVSGEALVTVASTPLASGACGTGFAAHVLDHVTRAADSPARQYDSNGSGVAVDDLDGDGRPDVVLGNVEGPGTILWNEGAWTFTTDRMEDRSIRAVLVVDVDGDARPDIVTTHRAGGVTWWRNVGPRRFERTGLVGVGGAAYSMSWADADGDGDVDLATASYDAELDQVGRSAFLMGDGAGVYVYRNAGGGRFEGTRLAKASQGLATSWIDLDLDGRPELLVGNDFAMEDLAWRVDESGGPWSWRPFAPFRRTSAHPMSFDGGDVDGDGIEEYFTTDMRSGSTSTDVIAAYLPLMATMNALDRPDGVQRIRNVLSRRDRDGTFRDVADGANVDVAGWAWSARFGDLDVDGDLDLYVVNGMIAAEALHYLPGAELVERNVLFRNDGRGRFTVDDGVGLDALASGRGSALADLDGDGRLDVVVNNLASPAVAYENRTCAPGRGLEVRLSWPTSSNTAAVGAKLTVETSAGRLVRYVRAGAGYLSGGPAALHVGVPEGATVDSVRIRWPDGTMSTIDGLDAGLRYEVKRA